METMMDSVYMLYRTCSNVEAGDILFGSAFILWFETRDAAAAVFHHTCEECRECLLNDYRFIRRNENCIFSSGYIWTAGLFAFKRRKREALPAAKDRVLRRISSTGTIGDVQWLTASLIAHDGEYWDPGYGDIGQPDITAIEADQIVEELADYLAG